jgi:hypothetical protein
MKPTEEYKEPTDLLSAEQRLGDGSICQLVAVNGNVRLVLWDSDEPITSEPWVVAIISLNGSVTTFGDLPDRDCVHHVGDDEESEDDESMSGIHTNCRGSLPDGRTFDGGLDGWCWHAWSGELIAYGATEEDAASNLKRKMLEERGKAHKCSPPDPDKAAQHMEAGSEWICSCGATYGLHHSQCEGWLWARRRTDEEKQVCRSGTPTTEWRAKMAQQR